MIKFYLNSKEITYTGDENIHLLKYLRQEEGITSVKDGCAPQAACGACTVEIDGRAKLACAIFMKKLNNAHIVTLEGVPEQVKQVLGRAFVEKGAVQCGFCTPGFLMRTKVLLQENPNPTKEEIANALNKNLCRCTGYAKIIEAIEYAANATRNNKQIEIPGSSGKIGISHPKYKAYETAIGIRPFVNDMKFDGMLFGALKFSEHPRAKVLKIDTSEAEKLTGVEGIFTAKDIPGEQKTGLIFNDWPLMIGEGETTHYIGDVLAGVAAKTEDIAREAVELIKVDYNVLKPITDVHDALKENSDRVHENQPNLLENCVIKNGDADKAIAESAFISKGIYQTQRIEHAYLEPEAAIAKPTDDGGITLFSQGQGIYEDRRQVAMILDLPEEKVRVTLVPNGGGFGGKEDISVQGHASLFAFLLKKPVKVCFTRYESIMMHPKRHPVYMDIALGCDKQGKLTVVKLKAIGDTGAYASVGTKVMERVAGHATGGYYVPITDIESKTVYTNNIPSGAMRGFGVTQITYALESCIDDLCEKGSFDRWQFRYDNALVNGLAIATGQILKEGVGIRESLLAVKDEFYKAKYAGLACALKNCGVGNGMPDYCDVKIIIKSPEQVIIKHGWTEMGQGVHNMALQTLCEETGIDPKLIDVMVDTADQLKTGMTTSSRATSLVGNAIIAAAKEFKKDLLTNSLEQLVGKTYKGSWVCDWTTKPGADVDEIITHYSYSYAAQLVVLNDNGGIETVYAAHDAGKIMNPMLFEGQIEGAVHMGVGYALTEDLPMENGRLLSTKLRECGVLKAKETPKIVVKGVEVKDPVGPYGAKGVGEIGMVPTAAAVANALCQYDGIRRYRLPMKRRR